MTKKKSSGSKRSYTNGGRHDDIATTSRLTESPTFSPRLFLKTLPEMEHLSSVLPSLEVPSMTLSPTWKVSGETKSSMSHRESDTTLYVLVFDVGNA